MKRLVLTIVFIVVLTVMIVWLVRRHTTEDYDKPLPLATLVQEAQEACAEFDKRQVAFEKRFPTKKSKRNNDEVLNSEEWHELVRWQQACDEAEVEVEEAKKRGQ